MQATSSGIGRWQGAGLLVTTLLGTSVFILPQLTIKMAGCGALWAWGLLTLSIIPLALVFASLASRFPHAAGPAYFVKKAFGAVAGRSVGIIFLLAVPLGTPAAILMTYQFIDALFAVPATMALIIQSGFLVLLYALNYRGIHISATLQLGLTLSMLVVLVLMLVARALLEIPSAPTGVSSNTILPAAGLAFWSFLGIEAMSHLAADFRQPDRDLKPAIMIGVILVGCIYLGCTWLILSVPTSTPLAMVGVFDQLLGGAGAQIIGLLGLSGGLAAVNVYTASLIRLTLSFSQEGVLPVWFSKRNRHGVSERALVTLLLVVAVILAVTHQTQHKLEDLVSWVNGIFVMIYFAAMLSAYRLLPARYHWLTTLGCLFCLMLVWGLGWKMAYALGILLTAAPLLWLQHQRQTKAGYTPG